MKRWYTGFTLIELLVVLAIISILATVLFVNFGDTTAISRDAQRKADLRNLQNAIELYKIENGRYPEACNGPTVNETTLVLSGHSGIYSCATPGEQYIVDLAPKFIPTLPIDPKLNTANSGYVYAVNNSGTVYKVMALDTVEVNFIDPAADILAFRPTSEFFRCGSSYSLGYDDIWDAATQITDPGLCLRSYRRPTGANWSNPTTVFPVCSNGTAANDYALSGGYSTDPQTANTNYLEKGYSYDTEIVLCR